jgi:hypothetical protein
LGGAHYNIEHEMTIAVVRRELKDTGTKPLAGGTNKTVSITRINHTRTWRHTTKKQDNNNRKAKENAYKK